MAPLVFVEVLGRNERVVHRHAIDELPCKVGRAYDNQVILDDAFVHAHHARIERDAAGQLVLIDLVRNVTMPIDPRAGAGCVIGRTALRLRTPSFDIEPARVSLLPNTRSRRFLAGRAGHALGFVVGWAALIANVYSSSYSADYSEKVAMLLMLWIMLSIWSGIWALAGRARGDRATFVTHFSLASGSLFVVTVMDALIAAVHSIRPAADDAAGLRLISVAVMLACVVTAHSIVIGVSSMRRAATIGASIAVTFLSVTFIIGAASSTAFESNLEISTSIMPLPAALVVKETPRAFLKRTDEIWETLDEDLAEP